VCLYTYKECLKGGFKRDIFVNPLYLILLSTLIIALLYELHKPPIVGDYFLSFNNLKVVYNAFIKHKFSFKVLHKGKKTRLVQV